MRGVIENNTYKKSEKESSKLRFVKPDGAWTVLMKIINNKDVEKIEYRTEKNVYRIDKNDTGTFDRVLGGEHKRVVPINKWQVSAI